MNKFIANQRLPMNKTVYECTVLTKILSDLSVLQSYTFATSVLKHNQFLYCFLILNFVNLRFVTYFVA